MAKNIYVKNAKYLGDFKFEVDFNIGKKVVDIRNVEKVDRRYGKFAIFQPLRNEEFVKHMQCDGVTLSKGDVDIAPEILYEASMLN